MKEPTFRITSKPATGASVRPIQPPPSYICQFPGCGQTSNTIACPRHLAMLPIGTQGHLTNALATGEGGMYGAAMQEAMEIWSEQ